MICLHFKQKLNQAYHRGIIYKQGRQREPGNPVLNTPSTDINVAFSTPNELNGALPRYQSDNIKYFISPSGNGAHNHGVYGRMLVLLRHNAPYYYCYYKFVKKNYNFIYHLKCMHFQSSTVINVPDTVKSIAEVISP